MDTKGYVYRLRNGADAPGYFFAERRVGFTKANEENEAGRQVDFTGADERALALESRGRGGFYRRKQRRTEGGEAGWIEGRPGSGG